MIGFRSLACLNFTLSTLCTLCRVCNCEVMQKPAKRFILIYSVNFVQKMLEENIMIFLKAKRMPLKTHQLNPVTVHSVQPESKRRSMTRSQTNLICAFRAHQTDTSFNLLPAPNRPTNLPMRRLSIIFLCLHVC